MRAVKARALAPHGDAASDAFPAQDPTAVREIVGASHGNLERVTALLNDAPRLANAAYDWGFGDWETALGAAAHTGRVQIAELLLAHGARPDIFALAMLGKVDAVRVMVEAQPGIQRVRGPHGITLASHARAGGEQAKAVVEYLATLADADVPYPEQALKGEERALYVGTYRFGPAEGERLEIAEGRGERLTIQRAAGTPRGLYYQGDHAFHPVGAPEVRITFRLGSGTGRADAVVVTAPAPVLQALRE